MKCVCVLVWFIYTEDWIERIWLDMHGGVLLCVSVVYHLLSQGPTLVRQITSAGWVAVWSSTLWYELWVIAGSPTHWECYSTKSIPSWKSISTFFKPRTGLMATTHVCNLQQINLLGVRVQGAYRETDHPLQKSAAFTDSTLIILSCWLATI